MYAINKFARCTWEYIATLGKVISIEARDSHYIEVVYENLTTLGKTHFTNNKDTTVSNGIITMAGFSISYNSVDCKEKEIREDLLSRSNTILHVSKVVKSNLYHMQSIVKADLSTIKNDYVRGSCSLKNGNSIFVIHGTDTQYSWAEALTATHFEYAKRINMQRVLWYKWLQEATFKETNTGDLFKFPNGLSVKFDNKEEGIGEDGERMFCETYTRQEEITRFYSEEDFLVWLTKYF